eukprot:TRINITY_DN106311_c0_g1_i1.p1 TRINITY_DN106311_c0_g1~~TRINITY_DN106311_c0_g1_i1.p1  ORF type:complete len:209 (-),score=51.82 TRINITY_DN106311_c0_g1_i1:370-996(-)
MALGEDPEDTEEAEAWAALREAFGESETAPSDAGVKRSNKSSPPGPPKRAKAAPAPAPKVEPASSVSAAKSNGYAGKDAGEGDAWIQSEVDRLTGEVQRLADGPFPFKLLKDLWSIPLEDQHEVLLGALGNTAGKTLDSKQERAANLWKLIEEEVSARGAGNGVLDLPPPKSKVLAAKSGISTLVNTAKRPPAPKAGAARPRTRSPSI